MEDISESVFGYENHTHKKQATAIKKKKNASCIHLKEESLLIRHSFGQPSRPQLQFYCYFCCYDLVHRPVCWAWCRRLQPSLAPINGSVLSTEIESEIYLFIWLWFLKWNYILQNRAMHLWILFTKLTNENQSPHIINCYNFQYTHYKV